MPDLTLARLDVAIRRELDKADYPLFEEPTRRDRIAFLAGMQTAANISTNATILAEGDECEWLYSSGHSEHQRAIRATVRRLRKEAKANG